MAIKGLKSLTNALLLPCTDSSHQLQDMGDFMFRLNVFLGYHFPIDLPLKSLSSACDVRSLDQFHHNMWIQVITMGYATFCI